MVRDKGSAEQGSQQQHGQGHEDHTVGDCRKSATAHRRQEAEEAINPTNEPR